jgi:hypothetical protein
LRSWNQRIHAALLIHGLRQAKSEPCIYYKIAKNCIIIVAAYVDDLILLFSKTAQKEKLKAGFKEEFKMKNLGQATHCLGLCISSQEET